MSMEWDTRKRVTRNYDREMNCPEPLLASARRVQGMHQELSTMMARHAPEQHRPIGRCVVSGAWCARQELNLRPQAPQACALSS